MATLRQALLLPEELFALSVALSNALSGWLQRPALTGTGLLAQQPVPQKGQPWAEERHVGYTRL